VHRTLILAMASAGLWGCTANRIGVVECAADGDCAANQQCDPTNRCVAIAASEADGGTDAADPGMDSGALAPILVDDFEDGGPDPVDTRFGVWQYYTYNPPGQPAYAYNFKPGYNTNGSELLEWSVTDTPNGMLDFPGAGLRTLIKNVYIDLSAFTRIVFAHRYEAAATPCASTDIPITSFTVVFGCDELNTTYVLPVNVSPTWQQVTLPLSAFSEPPYMPPSGHSLTECLQLTSVLLFEVQPNLADGQCGSGRLYLDTISIR
jgi:hypothetical protein